MKLKAPGPTQAPLTVAAWLTVGGLGVLRLGALGALPVALAMAAAQGNPGGAAPWSRPEGRAGRLRLRLAQ